MKIARQLTLLIIVLVVVACGEKPKERFNYPLVKSKLNLTAEQADSFDEITTKYSAEARATYDANKDDRQKVMAMIQEVFGKQDTEMQKILQPDQFEIYQFEMKIERGGREKYNMTLIKKALVLDSVQASKFDLANQAFYSTLAANHDNYHGKPDVFKEYYAELDLSRREALESFLTIGQYKSYDSLANVYNVGSSEH